MNRLVNLAVVVAMLTLTLGAFAVTADAAEMTVQLVNNTERTMNMKLFSNGESHQQWPSKTRAYAVKPAPEVQQIKITCVEGEPICWGAWMKVETVAGQIDGAGQRDTQAYKYTWGAGDRGMNTCAHCCNVCKDGTTTRVMKFLDAQGLNAK